ncbi:MAG: hypothetical protein ACOC5J_02085, partial [Gemmatimonadota bacterium]
MFRSLNAAGLGTMLVALVVGTVAGPDSLKGQVTDSPVGVALQHMLEEHVKDRRAVVVLDRFPRTDLVVDVATAAGHQAARRDQARECQGELSDADWECWITADAERL